MNRTRKIFFQFSCPMASRFEIHFPIKFSPDSKLSLILFLNLLYFTCLHINIYLQYKSTNREVLIRNVYSQNKFNKIILSLAFHKSLNITSQSFFLWPWMWWPPLADTSHWSTTSNQNHNIRTHHPTMGHTHKTSPHQAWAHTLGTCPNGQVIGDQH